MKKIVLMVAVLFSLLGTFQTAHAGWSTTRRWSFCWWWWGPYGYTASTHLYQYGCGWGSAWNGNVGCPGATSYLARKWGCFCPWTSSAYAYSFWWGQGGWLYIPCWGVWGGTANELLTDAGYTTADDGGDDPTDPSTPPPSTPGEYRQENESVPEMVADKSEITIKGIKIRLVSPAPSSSEGSADNTVTTTVWTPKDDTTKGVEDTVITPEKTVRTGSVSLRYGTLKVTGDIYKASDFSIEKSADGGTVATYVGGDKVLHMPSSTRMDGLALSTYGDVKGDEGVAMGKLVASPEGSATLNLYPNPASSTLQVSLQNAAAATATIAIYDLSGKRVKTMDALTLSNGTAQLNLDITSLPTGSYYLMVKGDNLRIVKQFTKQ